jgi:CheY-like chemotaxis protein
VAGLGRLPGAASFKEGAMALWSMGALAGALALAVLAIVAAVWFGGRARKDKERARKAQSDRESRRRREKQQQASRQKARQLAEQGPVGPVAPSGRGASLAPKTPQLNALHERLALASASADARLGQAAGAAFYSALLENDEEPGVEPAASEREESPGASTGEPWTVAEPAPASALPPGATLDPSLAEAREARETVEIRASETPALAGDSEGESAGAEGADLSAWAWAEPAPHEAELTAEGESARAEPAEAAASAEKTQGEEAPASASPSASEAPEQEPGPEFASEREQAAQNLGEAVGPAQKPVAQEHPSSPAFEDGAAQDGAAPGWDDELLAALGASAPALAAATREAQEPAEGAAAAGAPAGVAENPAESAGDAPATLGARLAQKENQARAEPSDEIKEAGASLRSLAERRRGVEDWWSGGAAREQADRWRDEGEAEPPAPPVALVVDDSAVARARVARALREMGCEVREAKNGQEAWSQLQEGARPNLVVSDIEMPVMDGLELARLIKSDLRLGSLPVIIMTAHLTSRLQEVSEARIDGFLPKPFEDANLREQALFLLNGKGVQQKNR